MALSKLPTSDGSLVWPFSCRSSQLYFISSTGRGRGRTVARGEATYSKDVCWLLGAVVLCC